MDRIGLYFHILVSFQHGNLSVKHCVYDVTRKLHDITCKCFKSESGSQIVTINRSSNGSNLHLLLAVLSQGVYWKLVEIISKLATLRLVIGHFAAFQMQAAF